MAAPQFNFTTTWTVESPLTTIWNQVGRVTLHPKWWPGISTATLLQGPELPVTVGTKVAYEVSSPLYTLRYQTEVLEFVTGKYIVARATGDLNGQGRWTFVEHAGHTHATFEWRVTLTPPFLKMVSFVPPARLIMRYFHNRLMAAGEQGLRRYIATQSA